MAKKFRKEIIRVGKYVFPNHPEKFIEFTADRLKKMVEATAASGLKTWIPYTHSRDPRDNAGWVEGFEIEDGKLYGRVVITDDKTAEKIENGTLRDVSIGMGPVLGSDGTVYQDVIKQVALVIDPHIREQEGFEALFGALEEGDLYFSASDRVNENLIRRFINFFKTTDIEGGEDLDEETRSKYAKMEVEFEAYKEKTVEMEAKYEELTAKFEAAETERDEAKAKVAEFEAVKKQAEADAQLAFEAEAEKFADTLNDQLKLEPAKRDKWRDFYLKDKELAFEAAKDLKVKFEGAGEGDPQSPPQPKAIDKENPDVIEVLKHMGYDEEAISRHIGEEE